MDFTRSHPAGGRERARFGQYPMAVQADGVAETPVNPSPPSRQAWNAGPNARAPPPGHRAPGGGGAGTAGGRARTLKSWPPARMASIKETCTFYVALRVY